MRGNLVALSLCRLNYGVDDCGDNCILITISFTAVINHI